MLDAAYQLLPVIAISYCSKPVMAVSLQVIPAGASDIPGGPCHRVGSRAGESLAGDVREPRTVCRPVRGRSHYIQLAETIFTDLTLSFMAFMFLSAIILSFSILSILSIFAM